MGMDKARWDNKGITKCNKDICGVIDMFIILIVVIV